MRRKGTQDMRIKDVASQIAALHEQADKDNDALLVCYFSRQDDKYECSGTNLDMGDALLVIEGLIKQFNLSPASILAMSEPDEEIQGKVAFLVPAMSRN